MLPRLQDGRLPSGPTFHRLPKAAIRSCAPHDPAYVRLPRVGLRFKKEFGNIPIATYIGNI